MANIKAKSDAPDLEVDRKKVADLESQYNEIIADGALAAAGAAPPPFGTAADIVSLGRSVFKGDWSGAALDALGFIPIAGDAFKASKVAAKVKDVTEALAKAKTALNAKVFATTRENAKKYWKELIEKRRKAKLDKELSKCKDEACRKRARESLEGEMDPGRLPSSEKGKWMDEAGNPVPRGTGYYKPDPEKNKPLFDALQRHKDKDGNPIDKIPFKDGHPDFSGFPPLKKQNDELISLGDNGKPYTVDIDMKGERVNGLDDFDRADLAFKEKYGRDISGPEDSLGVWHHEPDGVQMSLIDKRVHHAFSDPETGEKFSGVAHVGGNSMVHKTEF